jgi:hypothetical protein
MPCMDVSQPSHPSIRLIQCAGRRISSLAASVAGRLARSIARPEGLPELNSRGPPLQRWTGLVKGGRKMLSPIRNFLGPHTDASMSPEDEARSYNDELADLET